MISQEDYNFITRLDNSSPEQRIQLLKEKSYQVVNNIESVDENMAGKLLLFQDVVTYLLRFSAQRHF